MQGSQQSRIVQPLFTKDYVYFASDAPDELNFIYHYVRETGLTKRVQKLNAPVYYGRIIGDLILFSTVVEPSDINNQKTIDLWGYKLGEEWKCVKQFQKDSFSMKYFQYGQLLFPDYVNNSNKICFTESATTSHLKLHVYDAGDFFNL